MEQKKSVKGTKTEQNLMRAFAGESQARTRYYFFANQARKEGYQQIAEMFDLTAANETEHAKLFFKQLEGGMVNVDAAYPAGVIGSTMDNLAAAAEGEHEEWAVMYPEYGRIAKEEGFPHIARLFNLIARIEGEHEKRYRALYKNMQEGQVFERPEEEVWECRKCGYRHTGKEAPEKCPVCDHPQAYFELQGDRY
ncbi:MAG: rubrerythrin family protein [Rikenellaceae bacterium]|nr:rubrerythrin family protein [Rikenellaceae bacterium]